MLDTANIESNKYEFMEYASPKSNRILLPKSIIIVITMKTNTYACLIAFLKFKINASSLKDPSANNEVDKEEGIINSKLAIENAT
jgi:hypothetical protein